MSQSLLDSLYVPSRGTRVHGTVVGDCHGVDPAERVKPEPLAERGSARVGARTSLGSSVSSYREKKLDGQPSGIFLGRCPSTPSVISSEHNDEIYYFQFAKAVEDAIIDRNPRSKLEDLLTAPGRIPDLPLRCEPAPDTAEY